jgi:hypothetical protein
MRIELRQSGNDSLLTTFDVEALADVPQPGRWFVVDNKSYLVLQRSHRYKLIDGLYAFASVALQVKAQAKPKDARWWGNQWVIGDPSCHFNARSPLLRCAVLPDGPCERCAHFKPHGMA